MPSGDFGQNNMKTPCEVRGFARSKRFFNADIFTLAAKRLEPDVPLATAFLQSRNDYP
jgi:hypothetical protein